MGDQKRAQPQHEARSRWAASTDAADAIHVEDPQSHKAAHAASSHQRKAAKPEPAKAPDLAELKDNAEDQSMLLLDAELLDLARELYKNESNMSQSAQQIIALRSDAARNDMELNRDKATEADEVAINVEGDNDKKQHKRLQGRLRDDEREKLADMKMDMAISKADVEAALTPAFGQLQTIMAKASTHGLHAKGLERGTSYLRQVLERYSTLCLWMGLDLPILTQMKSELTKFTNHANIAAAKDVKLEKLGRADDAHANYDKAWLSIVAFQGQVNLAKGSQDPHDVANAVANIESHLNDAIAFVHHMDAGDRKQLKSAAHGIVADAKAVDQIAVSQHLNTPSLEALTQALFHDLSK